MINNLRYAVSFPTGGISLSGEHTFQPGITAISGRNGSGKSFIREMMRYGLFGKKALRGPASDYKTLDMVEDFTVAGQTYTVKRGKKEVLLLGDEQLAVGADAVNKRIMDILGFGLEVFDVVCAVNQKESERLTQLTPAKRKELIDDIVGLTAQEAVETACRKEAADLRREAETLNRVLKAPVEPVKPSDKRSSETLRELLEQAKSQVAEEQRLQRIIDAVGAPPVAPASAKVDIEALERHEENRVRIEANLASLRRQIEAIPDATFTSDQLDAAEALAEYDREVARRGQKPEYTEAQLEKFEAILDAQAAADKVEEVVCPKCDNHFHPGVSEEQAALAAKHSPLNRSGLRNERTRIDAWAEPLGDEPAGNRLAASAIASARHALERAEEKRQLQAELDETDRLADKSEELRAARAVAQAWALYTAEKSRHDAQLEAAAEAEAAYDLLPPRLDPNALDAAFVAARVYESQLTAYDADKARFDELSAEIADKTARAEGFTAGAKGLVEARRTLKAFLAPSLSRVATHLIQQMTVNAKRQLTAIDIDEDMNITADGQDVSTFNGAHATMINLALRLALQQVLVSRVMPVFIGDEIDSDLDASNSQAIADALGAVKDQLSQIVLISHKQLEDVDHQIEL